MTTQPPAQLSDKALGEVIRTLEGADQHHRKWLCDLHASMICGEPFDDAVSPEDAHCRCKFGLWYYHNEHAVLHANPEYQELEILHKDMHDCARTLAAKSISKEPIYDGEYRGFIDRQQRFSRLLLGLRDQLKEFFYSFDSLTGVMTRSPFLKHLAMEHERVRRGGEAASLALIDIDHFKKINDNHGHLVGDRVLQDFAQYMLGMLRSLDSVCRYGGEEFVVCMPQTTLASAVTVMERMRRELADLAIQIEGGTALKITVSIGLAELKPDIPASESMRRADEALYRAKDNGRNRLLVHVCTEGED